MAQLFRGELLLYSPSGSVTFPLVRFIEQVNETHILYRRRTDGVVFRGSLNSAFRIPFWTDYPVKPFGDFDNEEAPIRQIIPVEYDGDKYCRAIVLDNADPSRWYPIHLKSGYIYTIKERNAFHSTIMNVHLNQLIGEP